MGLKSGTPFFFMSRLVKILKIFKDIIKNWNDITCNCRVFFFCSLFYVDIQCYLKINNSSINNMITH